MRLLSRNRRAFTLVEVAVAISILAIAFTSLITLNTRYLTSYFNDRNLTHAALFAQRAMTMLEIAENTPEVTEKEGDFIDLLSESGGLYRQAEIEKIVSGWTYKLAVQAIPVPPDEDAMRRIDLTVSWGESVAEEYALVYFMKTKSEQ